MVLDRRLCCCKLRMRLPQLSQHVEEVAWLWGISLVDLANNLLGPIYNLWELPMQPLPAVCPQRFVGFSLTDRSSFWNLENRPKIGPLLQYSRSIG